MCRSQFLHLGDIYRCQQVIARRKVPVERSRADLRAFCDLVHAGICAAVGKDLLRDFEDALAVPFGVGARLAGIV